MTEWSRARAILSADPAFHFWVRWYDGLLEGKPISSDLLSQIALIPTEDWAQGVEHIAARIAEIEVSKATPMAERVEWIPETQRIQITPVPMDNANLYNNVLNKLRDALVDIRSKGTLGNAHAALAPLLERLDRTLDTYADTPQRVHDDMAAGLAEIKTLIDEEEIADDLLVKTLIRTLDENVLDIEAGIPEVLQVVEARATLRFRKLPEEEKKILRDVTDAIIPVLEDQRIQDDMKSDVEALDDPDPINEGIKAGLYRWVSRISRIITLQNAKKVLILSLENLPAILELLSKLLSR